MHTIPHLVKMCNFPFRQRLLAIDTAPLSGDKVNRPGVGTLEQVREYCSQLLSSGAVDRVVDINYDPDYRRQVYQKHLGNGSIRPTHNYKGYPILGTIFSLEEPTGDYLLHFDSDMMLYQQSDYSWIEAGIEVFKNHPEVMAVRPLSGPPTEDKKFYQGKKKYTKDPDGFYKFKFFSSRAYLIDRKRFDSLLPLPVLWRSYRNQWLNPLPSQMKTILNCYTGKGKLASWEVMVSQRIENNAYVRATMDSPQAWTIHPNTRSPKFIAALPEIIQAIESGQYPSTQAGYYDLKLNDWLNYLSA
ncbi:hypothetical protein PJF56_05115 [Roseofilum sp. BLCC_M91]|uniref:Glycosyl transferase n=2 Tax=Roseofilum TaxID=1233426 RepID=A0ABT7BIB4_9CYAN|nr:hypothetical protein [Roseofilum halophilum]MDJ1178236.1 hypothetical protein [Roseofilum halophilum BLCC-M91]